MQRAPSDLPVELKKVLLRCYFEVEDAKLNSKEFDRSDLMLIIESVYNSLKSLPEVRLEIKRYLEKR